MEDPIPHNHSRELQQPMNLDMKLHLCNIFIKQFQELELESHAISLLAQQNNILKSLRPAANRNSKMSIKIIDTAEDDNPVPETPTASIGPTRSKTNILDNSFETVRSKKKQLVGVTSDLQKAFDQVYERCDRHTYAALCKLHNDYRSLTQKASQNRVTEQSLKNLHRDFAFEKQRVDEQQKLVKSLQEKLKAMEQEKVAKAKIISEKERQLGKMETSLLIKDKLLNENRKSLKAQADSLRTQQNSLKEERRQVDRLWQQTLKQAGASQDSQGFLNNVFMKCKQSLLKQRKTLLQEQEELDKQHQAIEKVIAHLQGLKPT